MPYTAGYNILTDLLNSTSEITFPYNDEANCTTVPIYV